MDNRNGDKLRENTRQPDLSSKVSENPSSPPPTVPRPTGEGQTPRPRVDPMRRENRSPADGGNGNINIERSPVASSPEASKENIQSERRVSNIQNNNETRVVPTPNDSTKKIDTTRKTGTAPQAKNKKKKKSEQSEGGNTVISIVKCFAYITVVFAVSIIISVCLIFAANDIYGFSKSEDPVEITIPENATVSDVAEILHDNKIIKYGWLFKLKEGNFSGSFAPGTYSLSPGSSYNDLIEAIREKPPTGISWVTIPEGFTTDEIINRLVEAGIGEREKYIDVINNYDFDYWFIDELGDDWAADGRIYRLDGYLFPDKYQFYNASSEVTVIKKLLARFNQVFTDSYRQRAEELGYSVDDIINIAALIEKEAGTAADFGKVSSVFHNRLNNSANYPYLESDATIAYVIQHETGVRPTLTGSDIENNNSPYNSYKVKGLVPGPIANPSNSAILAALNPSNTTYYFFVSSDTKTYFSSTKAEHDAAIEKIRQEREENSAGN